MKCIKCKKETASLYPGGVCFECRTVEAPVAINKRTNVKKVPMRKNRNYISKQERIKIRKNMTIDKAADILREHNGWNRGERFATRVNNKLLGVAIDLVVDAIEDQSITTKEGGEL